MKLAFFNDYQAMLSKQRPDYFAGAGTAPLEWD
jgi:hypothetical protein